MIKAVLLDLDNTLLNNPDRHFAQAFMRKLDNHFKQALDIESVSPLFRQGIQALSSHRDIESNNTQVMVKALSEGATAPLDQVNNILSSFYETQYLELEPITSSIANTRQLIDDLLTQGVEVAITTNPIYPQTAILERLEWAGLSSIINEFSLITHSDNMHFSKPHPAYYAEVVARLGIELDEAIMVGDSLKNDIEPANKMGLGAFHITESNTLDKFRNYIYTPNWQNNHLQQPLVPDIIIPEYLGNLGALYGLLTEVKDHQWNQRPDPNEWSINQILYHLQKSEVEVHRQRILKIVNEENPFIISQPPPGPDIDISIDDGIQIAKNFRVERLTTIELLTNLSAEQWVRSARHNIFGMTTLLEMAHFTAQHDRLHINQLCQTLVNCD